MTIFESWISRIAGGVTSDPESHSVATSPYPSTSIDAHEQAWQYLTNRAVPQHEFPSLIKKIFSSRKTTDMVRRLQADDAQAFVDVIDKVRYHVSRFREWVGSLFFHPPMFYRLGIGQTRSHIKHPKKMCEIVV